MWQHNNQAERSTNMYGINKTNQDIYFVAAAVTLNPLSIISNGVAALKTSGCSAKFGLAYALDTEANTAPETYKQFVTICNLTKEEIVHEYNTKVEVVNASASNVITQLRHANDQVLNSSARNVVTQLGHVNSPALKRLSYPSNPRSKNNYLRSKNNHSRNKNNRRSNNHDHEVGNVERRWSNKWASLHNLLATISNYLTEEFKMTQERLSLLGYAVGECHAGQKILSVSKITTGHAPLIAIEQPVQKLR
eukprot:252638_1